MKNDSCDCEACAATARMTEAEKDEMVARVLKLAADRRAKLDKFRVEVGKPIATPDRPGRNDPCRCGRADDRGKRIKFKKCCGA